MFGLILLFAVDIPVTALELGFEVESADGKVQVSKVVKGSLVDGQIESGDILLRVHDARIDSLSDLESVLGMVKRGEKLTIQCKVQRMVKNRLRTQFTKFELTVPMVTAEQMAKQSEKLARERHEAKRREGEQKSGFVGFQLIKSLGPGDSVRRIAPFDLEEAQPQPNSPNLNLFLRFDVRGDSIEHARMHINWRAPVGANMNGIKLSNGQEEFIFGLDEFEVEKQVSIVPAETVTSPVAGTFTVRKSYTQQNHYYSKEIGEKEIEALRSLAKDGLPVELSFPGHFDSRINWFNVKSGAQVNSI